ncbi:hypothetical protein TNCV_3555141 [Trichonephila clavipes]|nr:hypothetical protein TNCV_3555141 [Trichonephila clavipes]
MTVSLITVEETFYVQPLPQPPKLQLSCILSRFSSRSCTSEKNKAPQPHFFRNYVIALSFGRSSDCGVTHINNRSSGGETFFRETKETATIDCLSGAEGVVGAME